jgi:hypothetical protein
MSNTYYKNITGQPHAYPFYNAQNMFIAPKGTSPYHVADDLTRVYFNRRCPPKKKQFIYIPSTFLPNNNFQPMLVVKKS